MTLVNGRHHERRDEFYRYHRVGRECYRHPRWHRPHAIEAARRVARLGCGAAAYARCALVGERSSGAVLDHKESILLNPRLRLYTDVQFASPYAMSVFVALQEKALVFDLLAIDLAKKENHAADFAAMSLTERVPVLYHDDFSLSESSAITEYLDEVFPGVPLYPSSPRLRARARQVQAWLRSDLVPIRLERSTEGVFYGTAVKPLSGPAQSAARQLFQMAETLLAPGSPNLFGAWSIADADLALMLNRLINSGDPVPKRLMEYVEHQWQRPSVQRWVRLERPAL